MIFSQNKNKSYIIVLIANLHFFSAEVVLCSQSEYERIWKRHISVEPHWWKNGIA